MPTNFSWNDKNTADSIAIRGVRAVAVYLNDHGEIVIHQEGPMGDGGAKLVVPTSFIPSLTNAISKAVSESVAIAKE